MIKFKYFFESSYNKLDGESEVLHHVTPYRFKFFKPLSHFGSPTAARQIGLERKSYTNHKNFYYHTARINLGNVVHIHDNGDSQAHDLADMLHHGGYFNDQEHNEVTRHEYGSKKSANALLDNLKRKNIHTLSYDNQWEDHGHKSYIITHPNQVRVLRSGTLNINDNTSNRVMNNYITKKKSFE